MLKLEKQLILQVLENAYDQSASEGCDDTDFPYSPEMEAFLVRMYKDMEPDEDIVPDVYRGNLTASMSGIIMYLIKLYKTEVGEL